MPTETEPTPAKFDQWAIVELMGRQVIAGRVTEQVIGGHGFLRVDIPQVTIRQPFYSAKDNPPEIRQAYTRYINPSSLYALNPCTEEVARAAAAAHGASEIPLALSFDIQHQLNAPVANVDDQGSGADDL